MAKMVMDRRAADNRYLHKDFHAALNCGIRYLGERFGEEAVRDYLYDFSRQWYAPLRRALLDEGLAAVARHIIESHRVEGVEIRAERSADELVLTIPACPAVMHMRSRGEEPSPLFVETTLTVNRALCDETPYEFELLEYDVETGRSVQRFFRRES